jgi:hypothetical protein
MAFFRLVVTTPGRRKGPRDASRYGELKPHFGGFGIFEGASCTRQMTPGLSSMGVGSDSSRSYPQLTPPAFQRGAVAARNCE